MIRKLDTWQEWMESDRIIGTAFLHGWDEKKSEERFKAEASGEKPRTETAWGAFDDAGRMTSTIVTCPRRLTFDGAAINCDEVHMVGSLPEARGGGSIRALMQEVLKDFKAKGDPISILMPFSFVFYRKFGFELIGSYLKQKIEIGQYAPFHCDLTVKQVLSQADANQVRALYEAWSLTGNLASVKEDKDWAYRGGGEFGERDWWFGDKTHYTYLFLDGTTPKGYLTFIFNHGLEGPFVGTMEVTDIAFDDPATLRSIFGFLYGMRAKITHVTLTLPRDLDLALLMPECDDVERKLGGHSMARVLDVEQVLGLMRYPAGSGRFRIHVEDQFLPENTGTYEVQFADGKASAVARTDAPADLYVTEQTFCQMALGLVDFAEALYKEGTEFIDNAAVLQAVFVHKRILTD